MIESMIKLAFKSTGIFAAFALACEYILPYLQDLNSSIQTLVNKATGDPNMGAMGFQALFILLCLAIIVVGYTMFSDIAKTLATGVASLKNRAKATDKQNELMSDLIDKIEHISNKPEQTVYNYPKEAIDPNRRINENMRPPRP